ncbi:uncharacterized protein LOC110117235 isoform X2 [Athalia rosae]|uniref:uncharacterized protein LOC110117235 isoform X2 n=1 Tax=Athalia rosae TaxID=37344 RepID=UPI002033578E|nr:uncharacterized protein LOC110117235 isoform X2 [Athalia rosae]
MLAVTFVALFCALSLNSSDFSEAMPVAGKPVIAERKSVATRSEIPAAIITRDKLIEIARYAMRRVASRFNITLQTTASSEKLPRYVEKANVVSRRVDKAEAKPTTLRSKYSYEVFGNSDPSGRGDSIQGLAPPCKKDDKLEDFGSLVLDTSVIDIGKESVNGDHRLSANGVEGGPYLMVEPFLGYPGGKKPPESTTPNRYDFEIIPKFPETEPVPAKPEKTTEVATKEKDQQQPPSPIILKDLTIEPIPSGESKGGAAMSVPFEAVITFTRQHSASLPKSKMSRVDDMEVIPTRDPPDDFPPYFETVYTLEKKMNDSSGGANFTKVHRNAVNEVDVDKKDKTNDMLKRQTPKIGDILGMLGISTKTTKFGGNSKNPTPASALIASPPRKTNPFQISNNKPEEITTTPRTRDGAMFQRQEIEESSEEEEEGGSLGSVTDLLPLVLPILEDLSDPNTDTNVADLLQAGLPLVQGLSQGGGDGEGIDFVGVVTPILTSLFGPSRNGTGTVLQAILPLVLPLLTPFIAPLIGPLVQASTNPGDQGGSSIVPVIQALAGPLSLPAEPGGISPAAGLISGIIASLSKDLKSGKGGSDVGALVSTLVSGLIAGGSAGISAGLNSKTKHPPTSVSHGYGTYGQTGVPR